MLIGRTWVSGRWISQERGLRNNRRNRRWLRLVSHLEGIGFANGDQGKIEEEAWAIMRVLEAQL